ncbi:MAG: TIGR03619 family F420-dependent LLM class oxidoreductase [Thaumarchaeota archaeon]|nr:TIGR03619 family F420-dependent LLM class oxidoreductase [Nitrososphaerota archaeon]
MKFGVCVPNYGATASTEAISAVAVEAEALGYDSVWTTDHLLMPRNSGTPYERIFDSLAALAYLAPQTKRVKLGISSLIIAMRNPVVVAKQLATVDAFSGGRTILAIGAGWNQREFSFVGSDFHDRGKRVNESIRLIRSLWRGDTSFESRWLPQKFEEAVFDPKPVSKELTIWIGGTSEAAMKRASNLVDAWHPNVSPLDAFKGLVAQFREVSQKVRDEEICVRIGLDLRAENAEYMGAQGEKRIKLTGNMTENSKVVAELESLGVSYAVIVPSPEGRTELQDQIEGIRTFASKFVS